MEDPDIYGLKPEQTTIPEPHGAKVPSGQTAIGALLSQQPTLSLRRPFGQQLTTPWNWRLNRLKGDDDVFKFKWLSV
jgi:hypothetical protein